MAEKITGIELNGKLYSFYSLGMPVYEELGITLERFAELLERDAYCPTLKSEPTSTDLVYTDTDGSINHFSVGQLCRWEESGLYRFAICRNITDNEVSWYILPSKVSELTNDAGYLTEHQDISGKVDKVDGKGLSTNDYTTTEKNKLAGIASGAEVNVQSDWNVTDTTSDAYIKNKPTIPSAVSESTVSGWGFTKNTGTITGIKMNGASKGSSGVVDLGTVITSHQDISGKVDKVDGKGLSTNDYTTTEKNKLAGIASGAEVNVQSDWSVTDSTSDAYIKNKPTIPSAVSESTVSGWGFTKNTGTITGIKMNGATKGSSGVVALGTVITSHQDISGKLDVATAASTYATKTALSQLQTQLNTIVGGDSSSAIESFNEIVAFLENVTDTQTLDGIIAGINTEIAKKAAKSDAITSISRSGTTFTATRADGTTFTFSQQDNNTTYTFASGTNQFTVTPSGGTAQTVTVTPSISNNVTYSGTLTSGQVAVLDGTAGKIKASGFTIAKSVPSDAKFSDTTYSAATTSAAGLMSASDKSKLDGIASGANKYSLPLAASGTRGGIQIGYTASGANVPVALSSEKAYVALTKTAVTSALGYTPPTTNTTYSSGTGLSLSGTTFSLATSGATAGSYGPSAAVTGNEGTTMNIPYITVDTYGRVTSISNKVYTAKNTTYSSMSESEANTGTAGTGRLVTAKVLHNKINKVLSDGIFVNYAGEYVVDKTYPAGAWVKFGGGDYIAKKSTSLPPIAIAALSSTALALVSTNTYALMGGYEEYGNKDDWFEINPASGSIKRISASVTLAKGDQKVICSNSSAITVKLPLAPHDGCEIWIAARSGNVTVSPSSGDSLLGGNKTLTSTSGWGVYIYDVQNATWLFK